MLFCPNCMIAVAVPCPCRNSFILMSVVGIANRMDLDYCSFTELDETIVGVALVKPQRGMLGRGSPLLLSLNALSLKGSDHAGRLLWTALPDPCCIICETVSL